MGRSVEDELHLFGTNWHSPMGPTGLRICSRRASAELVDRGWLALLWVGICWVLVDDACSGAGSQEYDCGVTHYSFLCPHCIPSQMIVWSDRIEMSMRGRRTLRARKPVLLPWCDPSKWMHVTYPIYIGH